MAPERLGKYDVIRKIASGGMSEVWLCRLSGEEGFEKKVAVKVIHPRLSGEPRFRELFAREARIAASLSHQNLVQVFDFGRHGESCYLAMEYVAGWNLAQATAQARMRAMAVPLPVWRHWVEGILAGLGYLHSRGIVHRDVSPSNVLLTRAGAVKIADFGIARGARSGTGGGEGREGKCSYMSPEQARGGGATFSSDLFAAAVVAAEIFLPDRLFDAESPDAILDRVRGFSPGGIPAGIFPREVDALLRTALAANPDGRYVDADAFFEAVRAAVPAAASRNELSACWDQLFPVPGSGEEPTVVDPQPATGQSGAVRESRGQYGSARARRVTIGAASALVAISIGGAVVWNATRTADRGEIRGSRYPAGSASAPADRPGDGGSGDFRSDAAAGTGPAPSDMGDRIGAARAAIDAGPAEGRNSPTASDQKAAPGRAPMTAVSTAGGRRGVSLETDPPGVAVSVDDEVPLGMTPLRIDISPWKGRLIIFRKDGYTRRSIRAESLAELTDFRMEMERQTGTIEAVQAIPWARVYDGDRYLGDTPFGPVTLATGEHRLRFVNEPLGVEKEETILVAPGVNPKIIVYLIRK